MKHSLPLFITLIFSTQITIAQTSLFEEKLVNFLTEKENLGKELDKGVVVIPHLLSFELFDGKTRGIYKLVTTGTHHRPYIFFFDGEEVFIVEEYDPEKILKDAIYFINRYEKNLTPLEKTKYFENILLVVKNHLERPGWIKFPSN